MRSGSSSRPRSVNSSRAGPDIVRRLPPEVLTVGVFRDSQPQRVVDLVESNAVSNARQLHGHETAADTLWVREHVPFVIKAFVAGDPRLDQFDDYGPMSR